MFKSVKEIIQYITEIIPYYVPEWKFNPQDKDIGGIFAFAFARMAENNYKQFEKILDKHYISFLNCLSIPPLPRRPVPATGFIVFELSDNAPKGKYLSKNTLLYNDENIVYLTQRDIYISNVKLKEVYCADQYIIYDALDKKNNSLTLFNRSVVPKLPKLYIGHETIFNNLDADSKIMFAFGKDRSFLADSSKYKWTYSAKNYPQFKSVDWKNNELILTLDDRFTFESVMVDGVSGSFICCSPTKIANNSEFQMDKILISHGEITTYVEHLFHGDIEILDRKRFEPFGRFREMLVYKDSLYIGCKKAFSNKGAKITITFNTEFLDYNKSIQSIFEFSLDYWNGNGFANLPIQNKKTITELFSSSVVSIIFICPEDMEMLLLNGIENIWIRIRLLDLKKGVILTDYDKEKDVNTFKNISLFFSNLSISYIYNEQTEPSQIIIENNNGFQHIKNIYNVSIFSSSKESLPSLYIGFDNNFTENSINFLFELEQENIIAHNNQYVFSFYEYTLNGWKKIECIDGTNGLQQTGIITLFVTNELIKTNFFEKEQYWIKMVSLETDICEIFVSKIYMNAVEIIQKTLPIEENYRFTGESQYNLNQKNVLDVEVKVNGTSFTDFKVMAQEGIIVLNNEKLLGDYKNNASITIRYSVSEGEKGNCSENTITTSPISMGSIKKIYNPLALEDGLSFETTEEQILRGTKKLRHRDYAVTFLDFEALTLESSYVIKCKCYGNTNKFWRNEAGHIVIAYLPMKHKNKGGISIKDKIRQYILAKTLPVFAADNRLTLYEIVYIDINLSFEIQIDKEESFIIYRERLIEMLKKFFDPITGNFNNKGYDIGWMPDADFVLHYLYTLDFIKMIDNYLFVIDEFENKKLYALPHLNQIVISEIR